MDHKSPELTRSHESSAAMHLDTKTESVRSHKRGLSVSFADRTDVIVETKQAITESLKTMENTGKLVSIREEYLGVPDDMGSESTALLKQYRERNRLGKVPARRGSYLEQMHGGANWIVGGFLLVSAALGAGILNYPVAYDRLGGIGLATVVQMVVIVILASTMLTLVYCSNINRDNSYHEVLYSMCGKRVKDLAAMSILISCFGICVTFLVIIGDQFDRIFATFYGDHFCDQWYLNRKFTILAVDLILIWPICYFKNLEFLKHFNILGIIAMFYIIFLNVYEYFKLDVKPVNVKPNPENIFTVLAAVPVVCLAYQTHELVVPVYTCLRERTISNFSKSTAMALSILLVLYCLSGTFGYLTFGSTVSADIMQMYDAFDPIVVIGILALVVKMVTTYPQIVLCGRDTIYRLLVPNQNVIDGDASPREVFYRIGITSVWNVVALVLALVTPNISISIQFLGAIGVCNSFIFPGLCMVSLARRKLENSFTPNRGLLLCLLLWGLFIILMGLMMSVFVIIRAVNDLLSPHNESIELCKS